MGGKGSKQGKGGGELKECDPDAGKHIHNYTKQCENKGCDQLVCKFCRKEYGEKDVCIDCFEVLQSLASGKGLNDLLNTDNMDKDQAAIARGVMDNDKDIQGLIVQMDGGADPHSSFNSFANSVGPNRPPSNMLPPPRGSAPRGPPPTASATSAPRGNPPRSTQPRGAPPRSQQPRGPPPTASATSAPVARARGSGPPRAAGAKAGPRSKARGAPPPPPRASKARPRGNPTGFKAAAEEIKANLDPWGCPSKPAGGGDVDSYQPSAPNHSAGGVPSMAEQLAAQANKLKAPGSKKDRPLPKGATLSFEQQIAENASNLKAPKVRKIREKSPEANQNMFANVLKPKKPRNTEVIDPSKLKSLQEPVKETKPAPVEKKQVPEMKPAPVKQEPEPVKKVQPLPRKSEAAPFLAPKMSQVEQDKVQVSKSEYEQFKEFQKFKQAQEMQTQVAPAQEISYDEEKDEEEDDEDEHQQLMIAQIAAARRKVRQTIKDTMRNTGGQ